MAHDKTKNIEYYVQEMEPWKITQTQNILSTDKRQHQHKSILLQVKSHIYILEIIFAKGIDSVHMRIKHLP